MSEREIEDILQKVEQGILESQQAMLKEKALHGQSVVISDGNGAVLHVPAEEILRQHPELRS